MEVPGRKVQAGPSAEDTTYCQPCEQDDETIPAEAYCIVCREFFCSNCANVHRKQKISRAHTLLDESDMPTSNRGQEEEDECTEPCKIHPKELIKYFCRTHQSLSCGHCAVQDHRSCQVEVISDIAKSFKDDNEYGDIIQTIARLFEDIASCASEVENNIEGVAKLGEDEVKKLRRYREEVNKYFEEREQALLKLIDQMKTMDEEILGTLKPKFEDLKTKLEEINGTLASRENNMIQLFIETIRAKKILEGLHRDIDDINKDNVIHHYEFRIDRVTESLIASDTGLGTIETIVAEDTKSSAHSDTDLNAYAVQCDGPKESEATAKPPANVDLARLQFTPTVDIPMKSPCDPRSCNLSSMLQVDGSRLLVADFMNRELKLVDMETTSMVSKISVQCQGQPWDMCLLPGDRVAVTMSKRGIQILDSRGQLTLGDFITEKGDCRGIAYHKDKLIVSYYDGKLEILNMNGHVIKNITSSQKVFECPLYLTVVCEGSTAFIYVSDKTKDTITKLDMNLNILQTFKDDALKIPRSITAVGNQLLICGFDSNTIMRLDLSTGQMTQLLGSKSGIRQPFYVRYCPQQRKLFVSEYKNNSIKVHNTIE